MTTATQEKAPADWLMPKGTEPIVKKKKTRTLYEPVSGKLREAQSRA